MCEPFGSEKSIRFPSGICNACHGTGWMHEFEFRDQAENLKAEDNFKKGYIKREKC